MIIVLLLIITVIMLFGAAAVRSAIGTLVALVAGVVVLAFALSFSATFWAIVAGIVVAAGLGLAVVSHRQQRKLVEDVWAIYEPYLADMTPDVVARASLAREVGDHGKMSAVLQKGMEARR